MVSPYCFATLSQYSSYKASYITKLLKINTLLSMVLLIWSRSTHHQCLEHPLPLEKCTCRCKNISRNAVLHNSTSVATTRGVSQQFHGEMANMGSKWGAQRCSQGSGGTRCRIIEMKKPLGALSATLGSKLREGAAKDAVQPVLRHPRPPPHGTAPSSRCAIAGHVGCLCSARLLQKVPYKWTGSTIHLE